MKKLMMAVAVVLAAAAVQAAAFSWTTSAKQYAPNIDLANLAAGTYGNSTTYLAAMKTVTWSYTMSLDNGTDTDSLNGTPAYKLNKINISGLESDVVFKPGSGDPNNNVNYTIVISGTYNDGTADWTITSTPIEGVQSFSSLSDLIITSGNATQWTVAGGAPVIPEPTTGLLVLLGVAGLALRRRRA